ncbi:unnamed protein product (mitochondrion) [Plasmodiophora brassicae]|uniref:VWFD domain-containing protein n=1 Tax=Plasmodiophora brassicae TaxID=37360 RepID=A0A0G4IGE0_PLABS|nr:hypothetical protein PBRA_000036 [Plasmodiophora brassicae]SPQ96613.1 unnamed protein product [Plasmodiophora brassicae]
MMCDRAGFYDWQGSGMYQLFKTDAVEVQCRLKSVNVGLSVVEYCTMKIQPDSSSACPVVIQSPPEDDQQNIKVDGETIPLPQIGTALDKKGLKGSYVANRITVVVPSPSGDITITAGLYWFTIDAPDVTSCDGMCGTCSGTETVPSDIPGFARKYGSMPAIVPGCTPGNSTTTAPPQEPFEPCNQSIVPVNPVFESEAVMRSVIKACMCGGTESQLKTDVVFARHVENCIYDKSLGPGAEAAARSNMELFQHVTNTTLSGDLNAILVDHCKMAPADQDIGSGVTYHLRVTASADSTKRAAFLANRDTQFCGAGTPTTCRGTDSRFDQWCLDNCNHNPPFCPADYCTCQQ